jgi:hypothetical protein
MSHPRGRRLWIGGTSGLAQTYMNAFPDEAWLVTGRTKPAWLRSHHTFCPVDFATYSDSSPIHDELMNTDEGFAIDEIVIGIRPPLACFKSFAAASKEHTLLLQGLERFLSRLLLVHTKVSTMIHISSVAAVDHSKEQLEWDESHVTTGSLTYPYDIFKRECEIMTERFAKQHKVSRFTNLRISAIFSDSPDCIQCGALQLQSMLVSCAMMKLIDCNSARNVASCVHAMLLQPSSSSDNTESLEPVYYYTRCTKQPVPYVSHLYDYQFAYNIRWIVWIPVAATVWFLQFFHFLATTVLPCLQSLDYLLIVASQSHSFDNSLVHSQFQFPQESILDCFTRRRILHRRKQGTC